MLAELLIRTVQATAVGLNIQPLAMAELDAPPERLLPPLQPGNYETNTSSCWLGVRACRIRLTCCNSGWVWVRMVYGAPWRARDGKQFK